MSRASLFVTAGTLVIGSVILLALFSITSPEDMRKRRLDAVHLSDLQKLAGAIDDFWLEYGELPDSLNDIARKPVFHFRILDSTGRPYEFDVTGPRSYNLCAIFYHESENPNGSAYIYGRPTVRRNWLHPSGKHCYALEVPKENS